MVGCTADVDARDNTGTNTDTDGAGVPIYWLNGNQAADDNTDFYDEDWDDEANDKNESGNDGPDTSQVGNWPVTGCNHDGTTAFFINSRALGSNNPRVGRPTRPVWAPSAPTTPLARPACVPMYGLSQVFEWWHRRSAWVWCRCRRRACRYRKGRVAATRWCSTSNRRRMYE